MVGCEFGIVFKEPNKIEVVKQYFCLTVLNCDPVNNELLKLYLISKMISVESLSLSGVYAIFVIKIDFVRALEGSMSHTVTK